MSSPHENSTADSASDAVPNASLPGVRIAMWSGPRNISTAMLRSFGNRDDSFVCDEPLYAHYLLEHGLDHPGRTEILDHHETDADKVIEWLTGEIPHGREVFYQKHMAHHLIDDVDREWLALVRNAFLIREPREMLTSLMKVLPEPQLLDTGLPQQVALCRRIERETGSTPPILDARDALEDPRARLGDLCDEFGIDFQESMLTWPAGRRDTDGIWAKHWYGAVEKSTGFAPWQPKNEPVPEELRSLLGECEVLYEELYSRRLH